MYIITRYQPTTGGIKDGHEASPAYEPIIIKESQRHVPAFYLQSLKSLAFQSFNIWLISCHNPNKQIKKKVKAPKLL